MRWITLINSSETAWSVRPSDFDLILTLDVGRYVNSRACVSVRELVHYFLACYSTIFPPQLLPWGQWASFLFSAWRPISPAVWTLGGEQDSSSSSSSSTPSTSTSSLAWFFYIQSELSAAGDTQWWKPQETCELTESVVRACSTISVPLLHHIDKQQHHFLWVTVWQNPRLWLPSLSVHEAWGAVLQEFSLLMQDSQEREGAMSAGDIWWCYRLPTCSICIYIHTHKRYTSTAITTTLELTQ